MRDVQNYHSIEVIKIKAIKVPRSGNQWIDALIDGFKWAARSSDPIVGYSFIADTSELPDGKFNDYSSWGWQNREREVMETAIDEIENVSGLKFVNLDKDKAQISFHTLDSDESDDSFGFAFAPEPGIDSVAVALNWSLYRTLNKNYKESIFPGSFYGLTFLHELCHAVGLKHPHEKGLKGQPRFPGLRRDSDEFSDKGDFGQNAHPFTQMGYVDKKAMNGFVPEEKAADGFLKSPGALDTAALQWMYGVNISHNIEDNVYTLPRSNSERRGWRCIWDTGGIDKIDGSQSKKSVLIDLRNATLGDSEAAGGYPSSVEGVYGGFTIAHDWNGKQLGRAANLCIIENAVGGKSGDRLIGNQAANELRGMRGDDILYSGGGIGDRLYGGKGKDQFWIDTEMTSETQVEIMDFSLQDRLILNLSDSNLVVTRGGSSTFISTNNNLLVELVDFSKFSVEKHTLFEDF